MSKKIRYISFIGYSLCFLYGVSCFIYMEMSRYSILWMHALIISALFTALFVCSLGVVWLKEWGRKYLVALNAIKLVYFMGLYVKYAPFIHPSYIVMSIIIIVFFSQKTTKYQFRPNLNFNRKCILVVDDDEGIQKTIKRIFLPNGYSVLSASTGEKGLQVAKLQQPDLIILDVLLPGIKGRDVCLKLKEDEKTKKIPVVFLTAKDSPDDVKAEKEVGAYLHLTKPVNAKILLAEVKEILDD